jgi:hypothetical protein
MVVEKVTCWNSEVRSDQTRPDMRKMETAIVVYAFINHASLV